MEQVILVDKEDSAIGKMEKLQAHREGRLHRAFSVFLFNEDGKMLLQQRAEGKYHSPRLWTNTCCSHPAPGEDTLAAANRRLGEEMGIDVQLEYAYHFIYREDFENGLTEHELDHVYLGVFNGLPQPNPNEVMDWKFISPEKLREDIKTNPQHYTAWFKLTYEQVLANALAK